MNGIKRFMSLCLNKLLIKSCSCQEFVSEFYNNMCQFDPVINPVKVNVNHGNKNGYSQLKQNQRSVIEHYLKGRGLRFASPLEVAKFCF